MAEPRFWELSHLSDEQLLSSLQGALRVQRHTLARVVAHLAEVEDRRLHLAHACSSLFSYCVQRLAMSEDEACRRIELARLARRFPELFGELASGTIGLSLALLLKPVLSKDNAAELIPAVRGASLQQARELLAARFPKPDVPAQLRKLPERKLWSTPDDSASSPFPPDAIESSSRRTPTSSASSSALEISCATRIRAETLAPSSRTPSTCCSRT